MVQPINNPQPVSYQSQQSAQQGGLTWFGQNGADFSDLIDVINPLQHIPIVNTIYREITGDDIGAAPRLAGGTLYGGPIGLAASAVNLGIEAMTGDDIGGHAWNFAFGEDAEAAPDPTGDSGETDFAAAPAENDRAAGIATLNSPPATATGFAASNQPLATPDAGMPSGFMSLVKDSAWAPVGNPVDYVPGQGPVAINRPVTSDVAAAYQQQLQQPANNAAAAALPPVGQTAPAEGPVTQAALSTPAAESTAATIARYETAAAKPPIPLMHPRPTHLAAAQPAYPAQQASPVAAPALPAVAPATTGSLPPITPLGAAQGGTAGNGPALPPVPQVSPATALDTPARIQPEPQVPLGNTAPLAVFEPLTPVTNGAAPTGPAPGAIALSEDLPGAIPQPASLAGSAGTDLPAAESSGPLDPAASAEKLMPANFFASTESRYNVSDNAEKLANTSRGAAESSDYLVPDFKPNQVINHSQAALAAGNPDLMLPAAMNGNARSLLDIAQTRPLPEWTVEAREQAAQGKAARYQQQMNGNGGFFGNAAFENTMSLYGDAPTRVTPLTWSRGNNSGNLL